MLENLTSQDVLILGCLMGGLLIVGIICIFLSMRKEKTNTVKEEKEDLKPDINMTLATSDIPEISEEAPVLDELLNDEKEKVVEEVTSNTQEEIEDKKEENIAVEENDEQIVLEELAKESVQDEKNRSSIEDVLKAMNEDLERQKYEKIDRYEEEQEENAVISYQELLERKMALNNEALQEQKQVTEVLTKTSYIEDEDGYTPVSFEKIEVQTPEKNDGKFSNSEFISPIFGRLENTMEYPTVKKTVETKTYTETKLDKKEATDETDEFLNTLKEFRNNL